MASDDKKTLAPTKSNESAPGGLRSAFSRKVLVDSVVRLSPKSLLKNPVMLVVEIMFFIVVAMAIVPQAFGPVASSDLRIFYVEVAAILLITVWFSTLSDALAEQQAKSTAGALRKLETEVSSKKIVTEEWAIKIVAVKSTELRKNDRILIERGDIVPLDAHVLEGIAMVDESLFTGESAPVRKAPGDSLIGGSRVVSDSLTAKVTTNPGETFIDQMIKMVESSKRPKTPNEVAVTMVLIGLTAIFTIIIIALLGMSVTLDLGADLSVLIALYVCLLPTTIGALLPAIGLSGMSRLYKHKIIAKSGKAIETAGDADVVLLDKTGTITVGNRQAIEFLPFEGSSEEDVGEAAFLSSWNDDTPEGRSILRLAFEKGFVPKELNSLTLSETYPFSASTRTSGVKITHLGLTLPKGDKSGRDRLRIRRKSSIVSEQGVAARIEPEIKIEKGAPEAIKKTVASVPPNYDLIVESISAEGETPIAITRNREAIGIISLKDALKEGIKEKIQALKVMGIRPVMITGDQPLTAKSIASEVGIEEYVAQAKPEDKFNIAKKEQAESRIVAMIGDGTNDAPALAVADVGLAMNSGTEAAKEAANMVDLESNPAKIIDVIMLGKQLLMTRGAVTTFSIANDVAKYFAIMPVLFSAAIPQLQALNILHLGLKSAVLSALIFNAIIIPFLIPLAMRGIAFKPTSTMTLFLKNTLIYGVGGVIVPFVGIKLIDLFLVGVFHV
ncbi:MAG TPA: HAD-IC family P-type ATPase [Candidatus Krumholzibacteriaceae bacterium]|nr:HAD-IC family P-type ATPase [Candidatus Krumholzibacteriaceae bacterium]